MFALPDFPALESFADVAALGSFTAAAEKRGVSQPAISMQVRQLERRLGVVLLERVGRRAQPTAAGRTLLVHVERLRTDMAAAMEALAPHRDGRTGRIRIGTGATACIYLLPPLLRTLRRRMPLLEIVVQTGNAAEMVRLVEENEIDFALVTLPAHGRALDVREILTDELVAVFAGGDAVPEGPVEAAQLAARPLALYADGGNTRGHIDAWLEAGGVKPKPPMQFGSVEAIKELVSAGIGCSILPAMSVSGRGARADLTVRSLEPRLWRSLGLVLRRDKRLDRSLRLVVQALEALGTKKPAGSCEPAG